MTPPQTNRIQSTWQTISLIGSWVIAVAGSFFLPLPQWASEGENTAYTQFIYFIATVIAGFVLIYTFVNNNKTTWLYISIAAFVMVICLFFIYSVKRESNTVIYDGKDIVTGSVYADGFEEKLEAREKHIGRKLNKEDIVKSAGGNLTIIWTEDSINVNRWTLILLLLFSYTACAIFLLSFVNAFFLFKKDSSQ